MLKLAIVNICIFLSCILIFFIDANGGLYVHSYVAKGDLYKISELQGSGASDSIILIVGTIGLFLLVSIINIIPFQLVSSEIKSYIHLVSFICAQYFFNLLETNSFVNITYSTIFFGHNLVFMAWFLFYIIAFTIIAVSVIHDIKKRIWV